MKTVIAPPKPAFVLDAMQTQEGIHLIKTLFPKWMSHSLHLRQVTAPMLVEKGSGLQDDLNGVERPVSFPVKSMGEAKVEVVHSLAKWKRWFLGEQGFPEGQGILTDMKALRPDEELGPLHSVFVDQWDWELVISRRDRELEFLKKSVRRIYAVIRALEESVAEVFPGLGVRLPEEITFLQAEDLADEYPQLSPKEREDLALRRYGAVFLIGIGGKLSGGKAHDGRAPDYDDWTTPTEDGYFGLNGDIMVWHPVLERAFELSSMGIRVDEMALRRQLEITGEQARADLPFHKKLLAGELPCTIGGGIGQSRLCMYLLRKSHIGEVQPGIWPAEMREECRQKGIRLL